MDKKQIKALQDMYWALRCCDADLEGVMPEYEPSGDRQHSGWQSMKDAKKAIRNAEKAFPELLQ